MVISHAYILHAIFYGYLRVNMALIRLVGYAKILVDNLLIVKLGLFLKEDRSVYSTFTG